MCLPIEDLASLSRHSNDTSQLACLLIAHVYIDGVHAIDQRKVKHLSMHQRAVHAVMADITDMYIC